MTHALHLFQVLAYIDPGSGSYFYQIAIASLTTVVFFFSSIKRRVAGVFKKKKPDIIAVSPLEDPIKAKSESNTFVG